MRDRFLHRPTFSLGKVFFWLVLFFLAGASLLVLFQAKPKPKTEKTESSIPPIQKPSSTKKIQHFEAKLKTSDPLDWRLLFELPWGEEAPAVGGSGYDPGSGNGVSGGAMPLDLRVDVKGDLYLADGYGPRMLHFSASGRLQKVLEWDFLRPPHFSSSPALCGPRYRPVDGLARIDQAG